jgi:hypothetical protein
MVQKTCLQCRTAFEITEPDLLFYDKISPMFAGKKEPIPPPRLCANCRSQRRLSFRNERNLYRRTCDLTGASIISVYPPGTPFPVFETEAWYTDRWDPMSYGRPFDFSRPFFEQFRALRDCVPRLALAVISNENCPYVNQVWNSKNCYLCIDGGFEEDALYCHATYHSKNITDCAFTRNAELSYDLLDCLQCYHCVSLVDCKNCTDAFYCIDCQQCQHVAFSSNLRGKQYYLFNKRVSKEEWERTMEEMRAGSYSKTEEYRRSFQELLPNTLRRESHNLQCEDCTGDYLHHSRSCIECYDGDQCQDLKYCSRLDERVISSMDVDHGAILELAYEGLTLTGNRILFMHGSYSPGNHDLLYCDLAISSSDCFGCVGIKNGRYCILNKRYTKEEYETLVPKIIDHMRKTPYQSPDGSGTGQAGEWGEFFPTSISCYAYNQSVANEPEYYPMTKKEVQSRGWSWCEEKEEPPKADRVVRAGDLPDGIDAVPDAIVNWAIQCEATQRPFKIIKQELDFYRSMRLPIPRLHPDERHRRRIALRNPRKLWNRNCAKCSKQISTSYAPERPEKVYCESCYLKEVY